MGRYLIRVRTLGGTWTSEQQKAQLGLWTNWVEVSRDEWMRAEILAGFISQHKGQPATSGFATSHIEGRIDYSKETEVHPEVARG